ncbi:M23 family metallopeptidase [Brumimicrobium aurantiacum]|uniref:M23 family peptidase n=1 Tax=Brumimicrobium aurantiacum TaxID=1737063 RepID=A0A3E1EWU3_9FLAO|nr:M23 family metallopeptidase [Brumimicrobium aurantiacum]RFC54026.1 M23 family peptidase [Brumimicrobium aurantiacum]
MFVSYHSRRNTCNSKKIEIEGSYENNEYVLSIKNLLECPIRLFLSSEDEEVYTILKEVSPLVLKANTDTTIIIKDKGDLKEKIDFKFKWGDSSLPIETTSLKSLPFPADKSYNLLQGNKSNPTHNHKTSLYAFDFKMKIGDTITSTQDGFVIVAVDGYKGWGYSDKWKPYANQIMIYDTLSHVFTMYGHLKENGSLVEVGQYVKVGEAIGLSGKTGHTSEEHLHFNVFRADDGISGLISYPLDSIGIYKVEDLKRHQLLKGGGK